MSTSSTPPSNPPGSSPPQPSPAQSSPAEPTRADVDDARRFALSEDWLATVVGLVIVLLAAAGIATADWIPL